MFDSGKDLILQSESVKQYNGGNTRGKSVTAKICNGNSHLPFNIHFWNFHFRNSLPAST